MRRRIRTPQPKRMPHAAESTEATEHGAEANRAVLLHYLRQKETDALLKDVLTINQDPEQSLDSDDEEAPRGPKP